jgi:hypothetical protein
MCSMTKGVSLGVGKASSSCGLGMGTSYEPLAGARGL